MRDKDFQGGYIKALFLLKKLSIQDCLFLCLFFSCKYKVSLKSVIEGHACALESVWRELFSIVKFRC